MSKRAEEAALKAYPVNMQYSTVYDCVYDLAQKEREKFLKVYEQAEKETIERAIAWLEWHSNDYIFRDNYMGKEELKIHAKMFDDLKKAMEEEK